MFKIGSVVKSLTGRDKNKLMIVVDVSGKGVLVCDGKERPLERPKIKNPKHLERTEFSLNIITVATNRALRKALTAIETECTAIPKGGF